MRCPGRTSSGRRRYATGIPPLVLAPSMTRTTGSPPARAARPRGRALPTPGRGSRQSSFGASGPKANLPDYSSVTAVAEGAPGSRIELRDIVTREARRDLATGRLWKWRGADGPGDRGQPRHRAVLRQLRVRVGRAHQYLPGRPPPRLLSGRHHGRPLAARDRARDAAGAGRRHDPGPAAHRAAGADVVRCLGPGPAPEPPAGVSDVVRPSERADGYHLPLRDQAD